ncbi:MAG: endopeptidase La [Candidatus Thermofonsia Clade 1 bacterium]|jgi:ATP-dependent Lon protease|uniref:Lon protease n=1 Tax=Candidatus Thermofonsia Clade 1 bacterium TaxID=2364210 RepID=A0A2M8Q0Y7_9CHLR|nr:MAG: endopeptidase La [Candidatus Thermofonsia Clade 1 bacterium]PJF43450.1 MAG: endopeptidase La [Candidatus Thermofonsia Clade 1 bacterium]RMF51980.1 MAG: endopeptidase La [Chloroflexota bacterium]
MNDFYHVQDAQPDSDGLIEVPLIPLRDLILYPNMVSPLFVGRDRSLAAISAAQSKGQTIIGVGQRDPNQPDPRPEDLFEYGTEIALGRLLRMPDGTTSVLAQGRRRVQIVSYVQTEPYYRVKARPIDETVERTHEVEALMRAVLTLFEKCVQLNRNLPDEAYIYAMNIEEPGWLADLVVSTLDLSLEERQAMLENVNPIERLQRVSVLLGRELDVLEIEEQINAQVQQEVDRNQREAYLREQMRVIQNELGEGDPFQQELEELRERIEAAQMPEEVYLKANKELERLAAMPPMAPEVGIIRTYLDWLIDLPWWQMTEDNLDLAHAERVLEEDHFGLPKAKERILEHIAVRKLAADKMKSPIICFVGPPGTGKTSLGRSIAKALGRQFVRVSLGGVRDEAEIRGHRRTYIGALPGRIIQTMRRAGTINPVFMLDEIDKLGQDFRGDPAAALLEVLDPEQNHAFSDHYLDVPYDLSKVLFITTANWLDPLPSALLDRLEVIEFSGYTDQEKLAIARHFLIPRQLEQHGLKGKGLRFDEAALQAIIREYTYEAGVRNLDREIANICRKIARRVASQQPYKRRITAQSLIEFLGPPSFTNAKVEEEDQVGLATGVAWTENGGDVMTVEVTLMNGKGNLTLTGQIGEVMEESVQAALSYTRSRAKALGIKPEVFEKIDVHLHVPETAVPKDGPSAGVTMAVALISAFTERKVRVRTAMTGEITLRGRILPVGGVKEKVLAAYRAGLRTIILPEGNRKDLIEVPKKVQSEMTVHFVTHMDQVIELALLPDEPKAKTPSKPRAKASDATKPRRTRKTPAKPTLDQPPASSAAEFSYNQPR